MNVRAGRLSRPPAPRCIGEWGFEMAKQTKNAAAVQHVQTLVDARKHGACEALVDAAIVALLAKSPVSVAKLADAVAADIAKRTGVNVTPGRIMSDLRYTLGVDANGRYIIDGTAKPVNVACRTAVNPKAGKLSSGDYKPRGVHSDAAAAARGLIDGGKPAAAQPAAAKPKRAAAAKPAAKRAAKPRKPVAVDAKQTIDERNDS